MKLDKLLISYRQKDPYFNRGIGGTNFNIALAAVAATIPVLGLAVTLILIVYRNRLEHTSDHVSDFNNTFANDKSGVYYVNFSATGLSTVASWASTVAQFFPGSVMSLYWYRTAASMQQRSQGGKTTELPTPCQYSLLLALRSGGILALWEWLTQRLLPRRQRQNPLVSRTGSVLILAVCLGILIGAADTWLHVTTETVSFDQVTTNPVSTQWYGRQLPRECAFGTINKTKHSCAIKVPSNGPDYLINPNEVYQVLSSQSVNNKVLTTQFEGKNLSYLAPPVMDSTLDFKATTIASCSECQSATNCCHANSSGYYSCSPLFNSSTSDWYLSRANGNNISLGIFPDSNWTIAQFTSLPNPFYTIAQMTILSTDHSGRGVVSVRIPNGGLSFFVNCTTSFFYLNYTSVNGNMTAQEIALITDRNLVYSLAEINVQGRDGYADGQILGGAQTALHENTPSAANEVFASQYDATFLATAASVIENVPNIAEQTRKTLLVARVQIPALSALVLTLLLSALLGMLMTFLAVSHGLSHGLSHGQPQDLSQEDQMSMLDPGSQPNPPMMENVLEEYVHARQTDRLGILRTKQGGWSYVCRAPEQQSPELPVQMTPEPKTPEQDIKGLHHEVFGIPLIRIESVGGFFSGPVSDVGDEDSRSEADFGGEVSEEYHAL